MATTDIQFPHKSADAPMRQQPAAGLAAQHIFAQERFYARAGAHALGFLRSIRSQDHSVAEVMPGQNAKEAPEGAS